MVVEYSYLNHILCNSINPTTYIGCKIECSYEAYVKSQLHFPLTCYTCNRNLEDYCNAYEFICSDLQNRKVDSLESVYRVLSYFYLDLGMAIINLNQHSVCSDFDISINEFIDNMPKYTISRTDIESITEKDMPLWKKKALFLINYSKKEKIDFIEMR